MAGLQTGLEASDRALKARTDVKAMLPRSKPFNVVSDFAEVAAFDHDETDRVRCDSHLTPFLPQCSKTTTKRPICPSKLAFCYYPASLCSL